MQEQLYQIPKHRFANQEIFTFELYKQNKCDDLVEYVEAAIATKGCVAPPQKNPIFDRDLILPITNDLMDIIGNYKVFKKLAEQGYKLRENPRVLTWNYSGRDKRGAAQHYHHDGWDKGGQVSMMLMLEAK